MLEDTKHKTNWIELELVSSCFNYCLDLAKAFDRYLSFFRSEAHQWKFYFLSGLYRDNIALRRKLCDIEFVIIFGTSDAFEFYTLTVIFICIIELLLPYTTEFLSYSCLSVFLSFFVSISVYVNCLASILVVEKLFIQFLQLVQCL